jgi:hypothetical protein
MIYLTGNADAPGKNIAGRADRGPGSGAFPVESKSSSPTTTYSFELAWKASAQRPADCWSRSSTRARRQVETPCRPLDRPERGSLPCRTWGTRLGDLEGGRGSFAEKTNSRRAKAVPVGAAASSRSSRCRPSRDVACLRRPIPSSGTPNALGHFGGRHEVVRGVVEQQDVPVMAETGLQPAPPPAARRAAPGPQPRPQKTPPAADHRSGHS